MANSSQKDQCFLLFIYIYIYIFLANFSFTSFDLFFGTHKAFPYRTILNKVNYFLPLLFLWFGVFFWVTSCSSLLQLWDIMTPSLGAFFPQKYLPKLEKDSMLAFCLTNLIIGWTWICNKIHGNLVKFLVYVVKKSLKITSGSSIQKNECNSFIGSLQL